jgi:hypothetical protein
MNLRSYLTIGPILDRKSLTRCATIQSGGGLGRRVSYDDLERYLPRNAFAASWAAPIQARI